MVGLSVVLEGQKSNLELVSSHGRDGDRQQPLVVDSSTGKLARVVHHTSIPSSPPSPASTRNNDRFARTAVTYSYPGRDLGRFSHVRAPPVLFLERCFLCKNKLLPGRDIYMYRGDRGFCSVECRCRQISMDEHADEEKKKRSNTDFSC